MKAPHLEYGARGEDVALAWLLGKGWTLVARNYRCKAGELDLVVSKDDTLAIVEVKSRAEHELDGFSPLDAMDHHKIRKFVTSARWFLIENEKAIEGLYPRLDVITVEGAGPHARVVEHLENAIEASS